MKGLHSFAFLQEISSNTITIFNLLSNHFTSHSEKQILKQQQKNTH